jgi:hypothetical protein
MRREGSRPLLIESAKLNRLNPQHYPADVLTRIADHPARLIAELLPWKCRPAADSASSPSAYVVPTDHSFEPD